MKTINKAISVFLLICLILLPVSAEAKKIKKRTHTQTVSQVKQVKKQKKKQKQVKRVKKQKKQQAAKATPAKAISANAKAANARAANAGAANARAANAIAANAEPQVMDVPHTDKHKQLFPGLPIEIAPRNVYNFVKIHDGVADKGKRIAFEAYEIDVSPDDLISGMKSGKLLEKNQTLKARFPFIWNGHKAELFKIFTAQGKSIVGKWVLLLEKNASASYLVIGSYDAKNSRASQAVIDAVKTARLTDADASPFFAATLTGAVETDEFKIAGFRQDAAVYTKDGKLPTESEDGAIFIVSARQSAVAQDMRMSYAEAAALEIAPSDKCQIISSENDTVNGRPAVIITAQTEKNIIFQMTIFDDFTVISLVGIAKADATRNFTQFSKMAYSFNSHGK